MTPVPSPDGKMVAFIVAVNGAYRIFVRAIDSLENRAIAETRLNLGAGVFWSPDSRYIGFFTPNGLQKVAVAQPDAPSETIWDGSTSSNASGAWGDDGTVVFAASPTSGLSQVSSNGGQPKPVTLLDDARKETGHRAIQFLPGGRHFLYLALPSGTTFVGSLDGELRKQLVVADSKAVYSAGYLLFVRQRTLMAQAFDPVRLELTGEPIRVAHDVEANSLTGASAFSASTNGVLAYRAGVSKASRFEWFDRAGRHLGTVGEDALWGQFSLSNDDRHVAAQRVDSSSGDADIWLLDIARGVSRRLTSDPGNENDPVWSPDGRFVAYSRASKGAQNVYRKDVSSGEEMLLVESSEVNSPRTGPGIIAGSSTTCGPMKRPSEFFP
jgi:hypothetical protein